MRRQYPFHLIEPRWQQHWETEQTFRAFNPGDVLADGHPFAVRHGLGGRAVAASDLPPKYYILDMFPYPSGAGLHVGHPEGYTATDILARYRRAKGQHVLHPMGWDAFGLPAEQYAVKTGQHPRITTEQNISNFTRQIRSLGFSYDWSREVNTTDPGYFKWSQWIFLQLYNAWFNPETNRAEPIETLTYPPELGEAPNNVGQASSLSPASVSEHAATQATACESSLNAGAPEGAVGLGRASGKSDGASDRQQDACPNLEMRRRAYRDSKRLAFVSEAPVNWCPELGTVLANEEVQDGKSEVGGFPVIRKPMRQWMLRITAFAQRLLDDLDTIDWPDSLKEMQRNWLGRSEGAEVDFKLLMASGGRFQPGGPDDESIRVFTTRPDTLFGATYMVLSPEHRFVAKITTPEQAAAVEDYQKFAAGKSDLERTELAKEKTGVFTGAYAINPVNGEKIPIWIADYVLATYGTGAIMAVPAHDERDFEFAKKFELPIVQVVQPPDAGTDWQSFVGDGTSVNSVGTSVSLDGLPTAEAKRKISAWLDEKGLGKKTINFKLRDWLFSRQRYWGEPFPIIWRKDEAGNLYHQALPESALPVLPPSLEDYKPTADGQPPLARATDWVTLPDGSVRETNTMPQWAGSCWYYLRYLDARNDSAFVGNESERYWMGGVGRVSPSAPVGRNPGLTRSDLPDASRDPDGRLGETGPTPGVDLYVGGTEHAVLHLLYARFWHKALFDLGHVSTAEPFYKLVNQGLIMGEDGQKMSKSRGNVVNPDDVVGEYGADAFRLYEMFMGPLQDSKPWNTKGVEGVYRFLGRVWRLFIDEQSEKEFELAETTADATQRGELLAKLKIAKAIDESAGTPAQVKTLHACIKKVTEDLEGMRFNTAISAMMVFVNDAIGWEIRPAALLKPFLQLLAPFAPHVTEELWAMLHAHLGQPAPSLTYTVWPAFDASLLVEDTIEFPVQVNGKLRDKITMPVAATKEEIEAAALASDKVKTFLDGRPVKKVIIVPKKLVNIVV